MASTKVAAKVKVRQSRIVTWSGDGHSIIQSKLQVKSMQADARCRRSRTWAIKSWFIAKSPCPLLLASNWMLCISSWITGICSHVASGRTALLRSAFSALPPLPDSLGKLPFGRLQWVSRRCQTRPLRQSVTANQINKLVQKQSQMAVYIFRLLHNVHKQLGSVKNSQHR